MAAQHTKTKVLKNNPFVDSDSYDILTKAIKEQLWQFGLTPNAQKQNYNKEKFAGFSWSLVYNCILFGHRPVSIDAFNKIALCLGLKTDLSKVGVIKILENGEK